MKIQRFTLLFILVTLCAGSMCRPKPAPDSDPTLNGQRSPVTPAIVKVGTNAAAALVAADKQIMLLTQERDLLRKQASVAAAQVESAAIANTNQPPSPATQVVARETGLALTNLPPVDVTEALAASARRMALLTGQVVEAERLYSAAQTEAQRFKQEVAELQKAADQARAETVELKRKHATAQAELVAADTKWTAQLRANELTNQSKLDAANAKADAAVQKAYEERQNLLVRILMGIGALSILAGIGLAIATSGASVVRSGIAVFAGFLCFGLSKVLSHPHFNAIFSIRCLLVLVGAGAYLCYERKQERLLKETMARAAQEEKELRLASKTLKHVVKAVEDVRAANPDADKLLEERLDYHTSPDSTRPEYVRLKSAFT